jgi:hypothetical protein
MDMNVYNQKRLQARHIIFQIKDAAYPCHPEKGIDWFLTGLCAIGKPGSEIHEAH